MAKILYPAARDRLLGAIADNGLRSCVMLSGDTHTAFVSDLNGDFEDERWPVVAAELCGASITSPGRSQSATARIARENAHILHGDTSIAATSCCASRVRAAWRDSG